MALAVGLGVGEGSACTGAGRDGAGEGVMRGRVAAGLGAVRMGGGWTAAGAGVGAGVCCGVVRGPRRSNFSAPGMVMIVGPGAGAGRGAGLGAGVPCCAAAGAAPASAAALSRRARVRWVTAIGLRIARQFWARKYSGQGEFRLHADKPRASHCRGPLPQPTRLVECLTETNALPISRPHLTTGK